MNEIYRKIRHRDLDAYIELLRSGFSEGQASEDTLDSLIESAVLYKRYFFILKFLSQLSPFKTIVPDIFVCEVDGRAVAFKAVRRAASPEGPYFVLHETVDPAFRNRGIGARMREYIETSFDHRTDNTILCKVNSKNNVQIHRCNSRGYTPYARELGFLVELSDLSEIDLRMSATASESIPGNTGNFRSWTPSLAELIEIKRREVPLNVIEVDPSQACPHGLGRRFELFLARLSGKKIVFKIAVAESGDALGCASVIFNRSESGYQLDFCALPDREDAAFFLVRRVFEFLESSPRYRISIAVRDYQTSVLNVLERLRFKRFKEHLLYGLHLPAVSRRRNAGSFPGEQT